MQIAPRTQDYPTPALPAAPEREEAEDSFATFLPLDARGEDRAPPASVSSDDRSESLETPAGAVAAAPTPKETDAGAGTSDQGTGDEASEAATQVASAGQNTEQATHEAPSANAAPTNA